MHGFGRIIEVPNKKKNLEYYATEYDCLIHEDEDVVLLYTTHLTNTKEVNFFLKEVFLRADRIEYRFGDTPKKRKGRKSRAIALSAPVLDVGKIMLSGILNENVTLDPPLDEVSKYGEKFNIESDEGINYDIEESAFIIGGDDKDENDDKLDDTEADVGYMGD